MQSRRELLLQGLAIPLLARGAVGPTFQVISEPNCLSQESAEGFGRLLRAHTGALAPRQLIVAASVTHMSQLRIRHLRSRVEQGACLIWESAGYGGERNTLFGELFDVKTQSLPNEKIYVRYHCPAEAMVRSFGRSVRVECLPEEAIAHIADQPVALRKKVGKGTLIFLGSMLGPHLRAEDREATQLAREILQVRS